MSKRVLAVVFSDLHLNLWAKFNKNNERTLNHFRVLSFVRKLCNKHHCISLFCGDLFHKPDGISIELLQLMDSEFEIYNDTELNTLSGNTFEVLAISGNHELKEVNTINSPKYSLVTYLSNRYNWISCIDMISYKLNEYSTIVHGVPYIDHNIGLSDYLSKLYLEPGYKHILLLHTDYPGAKDTDGRVVDSVENLNLNVLNRFDLVLCGHIHKPQRLSKKVYMIGAPLQQRRTDKDCKLGVWLLYEDLSMKFLPLEDFPKFIDVESEQDILEDGNYYTVLPKKASISNTNEHKITKQLSKRTLARRYMRKIGIKDNNKKNLLIDLLNKADESC